MQSCCFAAMVSAILSPLSKFCPSSRETLATPRRRQRPSSRQRTTREARTTSPSFSSKDLDSPLVSADETAVLEQRSPSLFPDAIHFFPDGHSCSSVSSPPFWQSSS